MHYKWENEPLELNKKYISTTDTLQINLFKFYISGVEITYNDGFHYKDKIKYHLIDLENPKAFNISKNENKIISKVKFYIGVDSTASVSGVLEGDLDPIKAMYWAWQSGYINMKIEGKSSSCKTRNNEFQFHIGGYKNPNYCLREIILNPNKETITITVTLSTLFKNINLAENNSIMIPGKSAMKFSDQIITMFMIE